MKYTYLLINLLSVLFPLLFSFGPKFAFYKNWKYLFPAITLTAVFFVVWDVWFTSMGVWSFNPAYLTGWKLFNLPVEEVMFFFAIPYASMFLYDVFSRFVFSKFNLGWVMYISLILIPLFLVISIVNFDRIYTFFAFLLAACLLAYLYLLKWKLLGVFLVYYLILIIPFLLVNGLLTGSFLGRVVVSYDEFENLGLRILTIPIEDSVYGMSLMLCNVALYDYFRGRY